MGLNINKTNVMEMSGVCRNSGGGGNISKSDAVGDGSTDVMML